MKKNNQMCKLKFYFNENHNITLTIKRIYADEIMEKMNSFWCKSFLVGKKNDKRVLVVKSNIQYIQVKELGAKD